jgi:hypothetical protein
LEVYVKSPVRENCSPGSVRGARSNPRPYLDNIGKGNGELEQMPIECPGRRSTFPGLDPYVSDPIFLSAAHNAAKAASERLVMDETRVHVVITDVRKSDRPHASSVVKVPSGSGASKVPGRSIK